MEQEPDSLREAPLEYMMSPAVAKLFSGLPQQNRTLIPLIRQGLPFQELEMLRETLGLPMEVLAHKLGISKATLHRRKAQGHLEAHESDRLVRFARLVGLAVQVMESKEGARKWLTGPQRGLGWEVPLDHADTEVGAREVEDLLGRIEYGVYS